ncbi:alpha/beta hydrolase [Paracoccus rhizosphaerae]|uniref:Alpha/beta hydrolase n=1 Tax=Paracoccus rhizosphaerae TaxID=1133347 RepID=A0ABV6CTI5_9RHOB|nr:alpha/beta hydrolase [Paracoccus rhizosphaerae]
MFLIVAAALAACAPRPGNWILQEVRASAGDAQTTTVFVATTRAPQGRGSTRFGSAWSLGVSHAAFTVSVPAGHRPGRIEWPDGLVDPRSSFAVIGSTNLTPEEYHTVLARDPRRGAGIGLFVHGYNHSFPEALYRLVQLSVDAGTGGVPVLFSWPSAGTPFGYLADRDAVAFSRDALTRTLIGLAASAKGGTVTVTAHSMGALLTMESLRQLRLEGRGDVLDRLSVILAAPDIDPDLFRAQVAVIGQMRQPMTILVSPDDRALRLAGRLSAHRWRVGALDVRDPRVREAVAEAGIMVIDISDLPAQGLARHDRYIELAAIYDDLMSDRPRAPSPLAQIGQAGAFVLDGLQGALTPPTAP